MIKLIPFLSLLFTLISCAITKPSPNHSPEDFQSYIARFEALWGNKVSGVDISIGTIYNENLSVSTKAAGVCIRTIRPVIIFNVLMWDMFSDFYKEMLVFHELGHCVLNRNHPDQYEVYQVPNFLKHSSCPYSLMDSNRTERTMTESCYRLYRDYYILELFASPEKRKLLFNYGG